MSTNCSPKAPTLFFFFVFVFFISYNQTSSCKKNKTVKYYKPSLPPSPVNKHWELLNTCLERCTVNEPSFILFTFRGNHKLSDILIKIKTLNKTALCCRDNYCMFLLKQTKQFQLHFNSCSKLYRKYSTIFIICTYTYMIIRKKAKTKGTNTLYSDWVSC